MAAILNATTNSTADDNATNDCYEEFESTQYKTAAALRAGVGLFSFLCCLVVVILIVLLKKYRFFTQRLILYLAIAAMVHSISYPLARVNYSTQRAIEDPYCYFGGLLNHYTAAVELLCIWCITANLFINVLVKRRTEKLELVYFIISYFAPMLWFWLPVWKQAYGTAGPWCGIRTVDNDCNPFPFGRWVQFGIWYIPLYISLTLIFFATIIVGVKVRQECHRWDGKLYLNQQSEVRKDQLKSEVKPLLWYPVLYLALNIFSLISQVYNAARPNDPIVVLWYLRVLTSPLRGAFIALVYALDAETRKRLKPSELKAACVSCCHVDPVKDYDTLYVEFTDSYKEKSSKPLSGNIPKDQED